jgi:hypothetical protein
MLDFMVQRGAPGVIGALDGKHWTTVMGNDDLYSYKDFHGNKSLTMLAIVNVKYKFWWVSDFFAGATHDGRIWNRSGLKDLLDNELFPFQSSRFKLMGTWYSAYIMTDSAFAKSRYFCKPQKMSLLLDDPLIPTGYHTNMPNCNLQLGCQSNRLGA